MKSACRDDLVKTADMGGATGACDWALDEAIVQRVGKLGTDGPV
jgi:hypothetical protein